MDSFQVVLFLRVFLHVGEDIINGSLYSNYMIRRTQYLLVFSIIYWLIVVAGIVLFSLSFQSVPIGYYALRANSFSPDISPLYYRSGLYDAGVGYYFILFPSTKQCLIDNRVGVINQNLQKLAVTYTLCYRYLFDLPDRLDPNKIYDLYQSSGFDYARTLIAAANVSIRRYRI